MSFIDRSISEELHPGPTGSAPEPAAGGVLAVEGAQQGRCPVAAAATPQFPGGTRHQLG